MDVVFILCCHGDSICMLGCADVLGCHDGVMMQITNSPS